MMCAWSLPTLPKGRLTLLLIALHALGPPGNARDLDAPAAPEATTAAAAASTGSELRWARSDDGLRFEPYGETFRPNAAAPELVLRRNGDLLALFDDLNATADRDQSLLAVSRSQDDGATWSHPLRIRFRGPVELTRARHAALTSQADGSLRLFFTATREGDRPDNPTAHLASAVSRNGLDYRFDPPTRISIRHDDPAPAILLAGEELMLYLTTAMHGRADPIDRRPIQMLTVRDGLRFSPLRPARLRGIDSVTSFVRIERGYRAYAIAEGAVRSLTSRDGREWEFDAGHRLREASDAAIVRLKNGSYLMLYSAAPAGRQDADRSQSPVERSRGEGGQPTPADESDQGDEPVGENDLADLDGEAWDAAVDEAGFPIGPSEALDEEVALLADTAASSDIEEFEQNSDLTDAAQPSPDAAALAGELTDLGSDLPAEWPDDSSDLLPEDESSAAMHGFAPCPNFDRPVDYFAWYRERVLCRPADNAYEAYSEFLPGPGEEPQWPPLANMFQDGDLAGHPKPWDPGAHPKWEESHQAAQGLRELFREATRHTGYAYPAAVSADATQDTEGIPLLMNLLLPHLGAHRQLAKAAIADAWRLEDGRVSASRMLDAWETTLRGAGHMGQGTTLIESLVGVSESALVQENARWALAQNVFAKNELQSAFDTLTEHDRDSGDPIRGLRGEHAFAMDITQYLFSPSAAAVREGRLAQVFANGMAGDDAPGTEKYERLARMTQDDARAALDAFDGYYRELADQMRTGYPTVRAADLDATAENYLNASPLTEVFLPALSRVHQLRARNETSRRATQLAYAVHLFKAQSGRWPARLDELPGEAAARMRTDPFTGNDFGYRLTDAGPTIYSLSENGHDDGGVHAPRWNDGTADPSGSDDHVFWPPQEK